MVLHQLTALLLSGPLKPMLFTNINNSGSTGMKLLLERALIVIGQEATKSSLRVHFSMKTNRDMTTPMLRDGEHPLVLRVDIRQRPISPHQRAREPRFLRCLDRQLLPSLHFRTLFVPLRKHFLRLLQRHAEILLQSVRRLSISTNTRCFHSYANEKFRIFAWRRSLAYLCFNSGAGGSPFELSHSNKHVPLAMSSFM